MPVRSSLTLLVAALLLTACSATRQIAGHRDALTAALGPDVSVETKRDVLAGQLVAMMHQAVDRLDPRKGGAFVKQYLDTNDDVLQQLYGEIEAEQSSFSTAQRLRFATQVVGKPYTKDALSLVPRFVDLAHPAAADQPPNAILTNQLACGHPGGHIGDVLWQSRRKRTPARIPA